MKRIFTFTVVVCLLSLFMSEYAIAGQITDTFDGTCIDTTKWTDISGSYGVFVKQEDALFISGRSVATRAWEAGGKVRTAQLFPANGIEASVDITATGA